MCRRWLSRHRHLSRHRKQRLISPVKHLLLFLRRQRRMLPPSRLLLRLRLRRHVMRKTVQVHRQNRLLVRLFRSLIRPPSPQHRMLRSRRQSRRLLHRWRRFFRKIFRRLLLVLPLREPPLRPPRRLRLKRQRPQHRLSNPCNNPFVPAALSESCGFFFETNIFIALVSSQV